MPDIHDAIVKAQQRPTVTQVLERMQPDIMRALPRGMDAERVARLALTTIRQSEMAKAKGAASRSLADCTPESFAGALLTAVALGLEPGVDGEAWLVPYGTECTFIPGYKGLSKLFFQHPLAKHLDTQAVRENDEFDYERGLTQYLRHKPALKDRGDVIAYYAVASLQTGAAAFEVMTPEEVAEVRKASPRKKSGDIADPQHWMERKTVLKQLMKLLPKSSNLQYALAADEQSGTELVRTQMPASITRSEPPALTTSNGEPVDPVTGEIATEQPPPKKTSSGSSRGGQGSPESPPSGGSGRRQRRTQSGGSGDGDADDGGDGPAGVPDSPGAARGSTPAESGVDRDPMTTKQRSLLMARWSALQMMDDRDERLLATNVLLKLDPGTITTTSDLSMDQASRLIDILVSVDNRDQLDQLLAGQTALPEGEH